MFWVLNRAVLKTLKIVDPYLNKDLFTLVEKEIRRIENEEINISKFKPFIKTL